MGKNRIAFIVIGIIVLAGLLIFINRVMMNSLPENSAVNTPAAAVKPLPEGVADQEPGFDQDFTVDMAVGGKPANPAAGEKPRADEPLKSAVPGEAKDLILLQ